MQNVALENEARFKILLDRWTELKNVQNDPIKMSELLNSQKQRIVDIVNNMSALVTKIQADLNRLDDDHNTYNNKQVYYKNPFNFNTSLVLTNDFSEQ